MIPLKSLPPAIRSQIWRMHQEGTITLHRAPNRAGRPYLVPAHLLAQWGYGNEGSNAESPKAEIPKAEPSQENPLPKGNEAPEVSVPLPETPEEVYRLLRLVSQVQSDLAALNTSLLRRLNSA